MIKTVLEYFKHASTWKGAFAVLTAFGITLQPSLQEAILALGLSAIGFIQVFIDDNDVTK